jgi:hypothetical protein
VALLGSRRTLWRFLSTRFCRHQVLLAISSEGRNKEVLAEFEQCVYETIKSITRAQRLWAAQNDDDASRSALSAVDGLRFHWPEYLMEAGEFGLYMFFACAFATLLQRPASPVRHLVADALFRRVLYGVAMGATAIAIVLSPWGKQSGAHFMICTLNQTISEVKKRQEVGSGMRLVETHTCKMTIRPNTVTVD